MGCIWKRWQFHLLHVDKISISMRNIVCVCCPPRGNLAWTPFWNYKHILLYVCRHVSVLSHSWFILGFFHNFFSHILNAYRICITESNCTIYWVCELYVCIRQTVNLKKTYRFRNTLFVLELNHFFFRNPVTYSRLCSFLHIISVIVWKRMWWKWKLNRPM